VRAHPPALDPSDAAEAAAARAAIQRTNPRHHRLAAPAELPRLEADGHVFDVNGGGAAHAADPPAAEIDSRPPSVIVRLLRPARGMPLWTMTCGSLPSLRRSTSCSKTCTRCIC